MKVEIQKKNYITILAIVLSNIIKKRTGPSFQYTWINSCKSVICNCSHKKVVLWERGATVPCLQRGKVVFLLHTVGTYHIPVLSWTTENLRLI